MHVSIKPHLKSKYLLQKPRKISTPYRLTQKSTSSPEGKVVDYFLNEATNETYNQLVSFNHSVTRSYTWKHHASPKNEKVLQAKIGSRPEENVIEHFPNITTDEKYNWLVNFNHSAKQSYARKYQTSPEIEISSPRTSKDFNPISSHAEK